MTSQTKKATTLRLSEELSKKISEQAQKLGISKNAYIITILSNAINKDTK